jgi:hypothetical protein
VLNTKKKFGRKIENMSLRILIDDLLTRPNGIMNIKIAFLIVTSLFEFIKVSLNFKLLTGQVLLATNS